MRTTLRLVLAGTVILALVGVFAVPATGQTDGDTFVTGAMMCSGGDGVGSEQGKDPVSLKGFHVRCVATMSDPRVTGFSDSDIELACFKQAQGNACVLWGALELTGPDGTWVGTWGAVHDDTLSALPTWSVMEGTGAYEGWTYWFFTPDQTDMFAKVSGIIYEGPPPPWGESLPLAPAE